MSEMTSALCLAMGFFGHQKPSIPCSITFLLHKLTIFSEEGRQKASKIFNTLRTANQLLKNGSEEFYCRYACVQCKVVVVD